MAAGRTMNLEALLDGVAKPDTETASIEVRGLSLDSRCVAPGDLFIALRGGQQDGHQFLGAAADAGASAALVEDATSGARIPVVVVPDLRQRLGAIAATFYGKPSEAMHVTAVTGTNGKTTVSQLYAQLVRKAGYACGSIGTLGASMQGVVESSLHTTPDPISLQRVLADWASEAVPFVSMEASSHALEQGRMTGVQVDTAVFTNLTRDHLDYHGDMQAYGDAKARLFEFPSLRAVVINDDDEFGSALRQRVSSHAKVISFGVDTQDADVQISKVEAGETGLRFHLASPWGNRTVHSSLVGAFNVSNLTAALVAALAAGLSFETLIEAAEELNAVPGRMQPLYREGAPLIVIDFAHTPDALRQVLRTLRDTCSGRLIVVFGCGGDRDRGKRPLMGEAVSALADMAVITSDNPRSEDPLAIIRDVEAGMDGAYRVCADRTEAIHTAIDMAVAGDCVLIAGKGHEAFQIIGAERRPFDDLAIARDYLEGMAA